jgi:NADPH-dependent curcumin reductase CurA
VTDIAPIGLGDPIESPTMSVVVRSEHPDYKEGEILFGMAPWSDFAVLSEQTMLLERLHPKEETPRSYYMGALGSSGLTAWVGMHAIGDLQAGETVVVSAAAGSVGSVAGQIARLRGCRVVGLVGSADKAAILTDRLGFDVAINYREKPDLAQAVSEVCPDGVDVFFDNVGGPTLDAMLTCMRARVLPSDRRARVACCGMVAGYNEDRPLPILNMWEVVARQIRIEGFLVWTYPELHTRAREELEAWVSSGELVVIENISHGLEEAAGALCRLLSGATTGKTLVEVDGGSA